MLKLFVRPVRKMLRYFAPPKHKRLNSFRELPGFDAEYYRRANPDVGSTGQDPLRHYIEHGWRDGRRPSAGFDGEAYLEANPDVKTADVNPLVHYVHHGLAEGRHLSVAAVEKADASRRRLARDQDRNEAPVQQMTLDLVIARLERDGVALALPAPNPPLPSDDGDPYRLVSLIRTLAVLDALEPASPSRISPKP